MIKVLKSRVLSPAISNVGIYHLSIGAMWGGLVLLLAYFLGYKNDRMLLFQLLSILVSILFFAKGLKSRNELQLMTIIAIFNIVILFFFMLFDIVKTPVDTLRYQYEAKLISNGGNYWEALFHIIASKKYIDDINDLGYLLSLSTCYLLFGEYLGNVAILLIKFICHLLTCHIVYELLESLNGRSSAKIATLFWGINLYSPYFIYSGLKENIFALFVALACWLFYKLIKEPSPQNFLYFVIAVLSTYGFRGSFPFYFISTFFLYWFVKDKSSWFNFSIIISFILIATLGTSIILYFYPDAFDLFRDRTSKFDSHGVSFLFLNIINAFVSPYPSVTPGNQNVNLITVAYSVFHMSFALFALAGMYRTIKARTKKMYPLLYVFVINSAMLIAAGFSMNARYVYPIVFAYYAFIPIGIKKYFKIGIIIPYTVIMIMLTIMYNNISR